LALGRYRILSQANQLIATGASWRGRPVICQPGAGNGGIQPSQARRQSVRPGRPTPMPTDQDEPNALTQARRALTLFLQYEMIERSPRFYANIERKLRARNMSKSGGCPAGEFGKTGWISPAAARSTAGARAAAPAVHLFAVRRPGARR